MKETWTCIKCGKPANKVWQQEDGRFICMACEYERREPHFKITLPKDKAGERSLHPEAGKKEPYAHGL